MNFTPNGLLDTLRDMLCLKNDAALANALNVCPPVLSKIRHGTLKFGPSLILRAHLTSGMEVRAIMAHLPQEAA